MRELQKLISRKKEKREYGRTDITKYPVRQSKKERNT